MKRSTQFYGEIDGNERDDGVGEWNYINSADDLFKHDIDIYFTKLDYKPLLINNCDGVQYQFLLNAILFPSLTKIASPNYRIQCVKSCDKPFFMIVGYHASKKFDQACDHNRNKTNN